MIHILMATYNGERYLRQQIESLLAQTVPEWRLLIRDDCSTDATRALLHKYTDQYPDKIRLIPSETPSGGAMQNFFALMREAAPALDGYFMFSDQDDVWLPQKIEQSLAEMHRMEARYGTDVPLLVHTDLSVTDEALHVQEASLERFQKLEYGKRDLASLLQQNNITGCTMLFNRKLLEASLPEKTEGILMHDWWMGLVAAAFGAVGVVAAPTVLYRQHGGNEVGARNVRSPAYLWEQCKRFFGSENRFAQTHGQAERFYIQFKNRLSVAQRELFTAFLSLPSVNGVTRLRLIRRYGFSCQGRMRRAAQGLACLLTPKQKGSHPNQQ